MASVLPMCAVGVFFAVTLPDSLAAVLTALVVFLGHSTSLVLRKVPVVYGGVVPDFNLFNLNLEASRGILINWGYMGLVLAWGISFSVFSVAIASMIFAKRDLK